jgi:hypothetical protein
LKKITPKQQKENLERGRVEKMGTGMMEKQKMDMILNMEELMDLFLQYHYPLQYHYHHHLIQKKPSPQLPTYSSPLQTIFPLRNYQYHQNLH